MIYFDASALVPLFALEENSSLVCEIADRDRSEIVLSDFAAGEFASAVARLVRMKLYSTEQGRDVFRGFDEWALVRTTPIECEAVDIRLATAYVRRMDLPLRLPDAIHLAICRRIGAQFFSLDAPLRRAADQIGLKRINPQP